jgi:hypothetical protein
MTKPLDLWVGRVFSILTISRVCNRFWHQQFHYGAIFATIPIRWVWSALLMKYVVELYNTRACIDR